MPDRLREERSGKPAQQAFDLRNHDRSSALGQVTATALALGQSEQEPLFRFSGNRPGPALLPLQKLRTTDCFVYKPQRTYRAPAEIYLTQCSSRLRGLTSC